MDTQGKHNTRPALRRLPKAKKRLRHGITTIDDAVDYLRATGKRDWELVAAAQQLVNAKMEYSRHNGWATPARAFRRGMGYCQQQATALLIILRHLMPGIRCKGGSKRVQGLSGSTFDQSTTCPFG